MRNSKFFKFQIPNWERNSKKEIPNSNFKLGVELCCKSKIKISINYLDVLVIIADRIFLNSSISNNKDSDAIF
jgi:hypothetical protein